MEDTKVPHPEGGPDDLHWVRRMVFLSTCSLTQSEAYLAHRQIETHGKQVHSMSFPFCTEPTLASRLCKISVGCATAGALVNISTFRMAFNLSCYCLLSAKSKSTH